MRSGSDIGILGGIRDRHILDNDLIQKEYVLHYTNASSVGKDYSFKDGLFSGFDEAGRKYDKKSWILKWMKTACPNGT